MAFSYQFLIKSLTVTLAFVSLVGCGRNFEAVKVRTSNGPTSTGAGAPSKDETNQGQNQGQGTPGGAPAETGNGAKADDQVDQNASAKNADGASAQAAGDTVAAPEGGKDTKVAATVEAKKDSADVAAPKETSEVKPVAAIDSSDVKPDSSKDSSNVAPVTRHDAIENGNKVVKSDNKKTETVSSQIFMAASAYRGSGYVVVKVLAALGAKVYNFAYSINDSELKKDINVKAKLVNYEQILPSFKNVIAKDAAEDVTSLIEVAVMCDEGCKTITMTLQASESAETGANQSIGTVVLRQASVTGDLALFAIDQSASSIHDLKDVDALRQEIFLKIQQQEALKKLLPKKHTSSGDTTQRADTTGKATR